jgi:hypothetical protein
MVSTLELKTIDRSDRPGWLAKRGESRQFEQRDIDQPRFAAFVCVTLGDAYATLQYIWST